MRPELENLPEAWPGQPTWFWHGEQILALLEVHKPTICVELGTWRGGSAIAVARVISRWGGHLTCVDPWCEIPMSECAENVARAGVSSTIQLLQAKSNTAAIEWTNGPIDYLYIDGDHSYEWCLSDLELWWLHVRVGGLIAGDDYDDPKYPGVTKAWDEFERRYGQNFRRKSTPGTDPPGTRLIWGVKQ